MTLSIVPRSRWLKIRKVNGLWRVSSRPVELIPRNGRIVLIIHGYDNQPSEAGHKYDVFFEQLREFVPTHVFEYIWEVYWPGFWPRSLKIEPLAALSYPKQSRDAPDIARALANYVASGTGHVREVLFIAHSLGCRVVLEAIAQWQAQHDAIRVPAMCLMAAAVPTGMIRPNGRLREAAERAEKQYILHSTADRTLRWFFSPGEFAARFEGFPEAVGRYGNPKKFWDKGVMNRLNTWLDHGDYYFGRTKKKPWAPNLVVAMIARMFGRVWLWYIPGNDPYIVEWTLPSSDELPVSSLPINNVRDL